MHFNDISWMSKGSEKIIHIWNLKKKPILFYFTEPSNLTIPTEQKNSNHFLYLSIHLHKNKGFKKKPWFSKVHHTKVLPLTLLDLSRIQSILIIWINFFYQNKMHCEGYSYPLQSNKFRELRQGSIIHWRWATQQRWLQILFGNERCVGLLRLCSIPGLFS